MTTQGYQSVEFIPTTSLLILIIGFLVYLYLSRRDDLDRIYKYYSNSPFAKFFVNMIPYLGHSLDQFLEHTNDEGSLICQLLDFSPGETIYIVRPEIDKQQEQTKEPSEFLYLGKYGDIDAFIHTLVAFSNNFPTLNVKHTTSRNFDKYAENIILIGGPAYNRVTERFLSSDESIPYGFQKQENGEIVMTTNSKEWTKNTEGEDVTDYGFFLRKENKFNRAKNIIMICGISVYSVEASSKAFLPGIDNSTDEIEQIEENCKKVIKELGDNPDFAATIRTTGTEGSVGVPKVRTDRADDWLFRL